MCQFWEPWTQFVVTGIKSRDDFKNFTTEFNRNPKQTRHTGSEGASPFKVHTSDKQTWIQIPVLPPSIPEESLKFSELPFPQQ